MVNIIYVINARTSPVMYGSGPWELSTPVPVRSLVHHCGGFESGSGLIVFLPVITVLCVFYDTAQAVKRGLSVRIMQVSGVMIFF